MRFLRWAAALGAVWLMAACVTPPPPGYEPQIIRVTGRAHSDDLAALEQDLSNPPEAKPEVKAGRSDGDWARRALTATATGSPPTSFPNKETRRLMAKREAVGKAWRDLAQQIEHIQISGGRRVGDFTESDPQVRDAVERIIHNADITKESENPDGSYEVVLSMRLDSLASVIPGSGAGPSKTPAAPEGDRAPKAGERSRLREETRQAAEKDARERLMELVKGSAIGPNTLVGNVMSGDGRLSQKVEQMVASTPVRATRYPRPGDCEVDVYFDLAPVKQMARQW